MNSQQLKKTAITAIVCFAAAACLARAATYTSPRQLALNDVYQLNVDYASGDEATTEPKTDANDGVGGDNPYYRRTNVARAHVGGCPERYWYTSSYQEAGEPDTLGAQYVDYTPPFGPGASELTPGRYRINVQYRTTSSRASYPALYTVYDATGSTTVPVDQLGGGTGSCLSTDLGSFDLTTGSYVHVVDTGDSSIVFNRMQFTYLGPAGGVPYVNAGADQSVVLPGQVNLDGTAVDDDGLPSPLATTWSQTSGPGVATFGDASATDTTVSFSQDGVYVLRLTANDGTNAPFDELTINVFPAGSCQLAVLPACGDRQSTAYSVFRNRWEAYPTAPIPPAQFTLQNLGGTPISYSVTEVTSPTNTAVTDYAWINIENPNGIISASGTVVVTVNFLGSAVAAVPAGDADGAVTNSGCLAFAEGTCGLATLTRRICMTALRSDATSVHLYNGAVNPTAADSAGPPASGYNFSIQEGTAQGYVDNDPDALDGMAWRMVDTSLTKTKYRAGRPSPLPDPLVITRTGVTIVGRLRVRSHSGADGGQLIFWDGHLSSDFFWGGPDGRLGEINRNVFTTIPGDDQYHVFRMTAIGDNDCNRIITLYVDEEQTPAAILTIPNAILVSNSSGYDGLGFGAGSTAGLQDVAFDYVNLTNAGAFAPGEEVPVIGQSLALGRNCETPWVDSDADGDVDMDDFASLQRCVNGFSEFSSAMLPGCECFDAVSPHAIVDEFDLNYFFKCVSGPEVGWSATVDCPN